MVDAFNATLEACGPALGRFRAYRIVAGTDFTATKEGIRFEGKQDTQTKRYPDSGRTL
jgi:hypothetical protein